MNITVTVRKSIFLQFQKWDFPFPEKKACDKLVAIVTNIKVINH